MRRPRPKTRVTRLDILLNIIIVEQNIYNLVLKTIKIQLQPACPPSSHQHLYFLIIIMQDEEAETIEFLKIRLMARDREVSDFETKIKKIDFKHSRDLKESKIAEERAKGLLKEEKKRVDRLTAQVKEAQEQSRLLTMRLAELREEKEREVTQVRTQYNGIKEEVRTYERILPTLTFLQDYALSMSKIPPYEDIFLLTRSQSQELVHLKSQLIYQRKTNEESARIHKQNQQLLKGKKLQVEKALNEILPKMVDLEQQSSDLRAHNEQLASEIVELKDQKQLLEEKGQSLSSTVRQYELKLQELDRAYSYEMLSKEEEIKALTQEEFNHYESEIQSLENRLEMKDNMYLQQIEILEQEVYYLQGRITEEKEHFQENYTVIKGQIDRMREQVQSQRQEHEYLKQTHEQLKKQLVIITKAKQQLQLKVKLQQIKLQNIKMSQQEHQSRTVTDDQMSKMKDLQQSYTLLKEKYQSVKVNLKTAEEENEMLEEELALTKIELNRKNTPEPHILEVPQHLFKFGESLRKKSMDFDKCNENQQVLTLYQNEDIKRERKKSEELSRQLEIAEIERNSLKEKEGEYQIRLSVSVDKEEKIEEQLNNLRRQREHSMSENIQLREKLSQLIKNIGEKDQNITSQNKNYNFLKNKTEHLQTQHSKLSEQLKRDKETIKCLREEIKQLKESSIQQAEKVIRERKEFYQTYESLKGEKDRIKNQLISKEKNLTLQLLQLKKTLENTEQIKKQLETIKTESEIQNKTTEILISQLKQLRNSLTEIVKEKELLTESLNRKQKENKALSDALERERRERTLLAVPSLGKIGSDSENKAFNEIYAMVTQKQSQISFMERQISDFKEEIEGLKLSQNAKIQNMEAQQNQYIKTIIEMKMRCAQSEMKASQSQYLYSKLKKKIGMSVSA